MTFTAPVAHLIPGMMSLSVMGRSAQMIPQFPTAKTWFDGKKSKKQSTHMIKGFTNIMIGTTMIKPVAGMVSGL